MTKSTPRLVQGRETQRGSLRLSIQLSCFPVRKGSCSTRAPQIMASYGMRFRTGSSGDLHQASHMEDARGLLPRSTFVVSHKDSRHSLFACVAAQQPPAHGSIGSASPVWPGSLTSGRLSILISFRHFGVLTPPPLFTDESSTHQSYAKPTNRPACNSSRARTGVSAHP